MWERLAELAERERELVAGASWEELTDIQAERQELIDRLPTPPPAAAKGPLRAALVQSRATQAALQAALSEVEAAIGAVRRGRRAVSAYGYSAGAAIERRA